MKKISCIVSCPISTYSGYGSRSRDFVKALIETYSNWDVKILPQRWGTTRMSFLEDNNDTFFTPRILTSLTYKPDVWIQITVPNEFQPIGVFNVGVTAGIEATIVDSSWVQGCNRMDLVLTSSKHSVDSFKKSVFEVKNEKTGILQGTIQLQKPIEVLFEGVDTALFNSSYEDKATGICKLLNEVPEKFCFLFVGHWLKGDFGQDRKNVGYTIKAFLETFKNRPNPPALLLKTSHATTSVLDRDEIVKKIQAIKRGVKGKHPNIYLLHGDVANSEMNTLYNHPKVKCMISFTKGEGFGRPLLEFSLSQKPIIASKWSGHLDFLKEEFTCLLDGTLTNIHPSALVKDIFLKQAQWFTPDDGAVGSSLKDVLKNYKKYKDKAKRQSFHSKKNFSFEKMKEALKDLIDKHMPQFPEQVELNLPTLKLPKLKKIE